MRRTPAPGTDTQRPGGFVSRPSWWCSCQEECSAPSLVRPCGRPGASRDNQRPGQPTAVLVRPGASWCAHQAAAWCVPGDRSSCHQAAGTVATRQPHPTSCIHGLMRDCDETNQNTNTRSHNRTYVRSADPEKPGRAGGRAGGLLRTSSSQNFFGRHTTEKKLEIPADVL
jgi:hypothetical protein